MSAVNIPEGIPSIDTPRIPSPGGDALDKLESKIGRFNDILNRFLTRFNIVLEEQTGKTLDTLGRIQQKGALKIGGTVGRTVGSMGVAVFLGALSAIPGVGSAVSIARGADSVGTAMGKILEIVADTMNELATLAIELKGKFNTPEQRALVEAITDILAVNIIIVGEILKVLGIDEPDKFTKNLRELGVDIGSLNMGDLMTALYNVPNYVFSLMSPENLTGMITSRLDTIARDLREKGFEVELPKVDIGELRKKVTDGFLPGVAEGIRTQLNEGIDAGGDMAKSGIANMRNRMSGGLGRKN